MASDSINTTGVSSSGPPPVPQGGFSVSLNPAADSSGPPPAPAGYKVKLNPALDPAIQGNLDKTQRIIDSRKGEGPLQSFVDQLPDVRSIATNAWTDAKNGIKGAITGDYGQGPGVVPPPPASTGDPYAGALGGIAQTIQGQGTKVGQQLGEGNYGGAAGTLAGSVLPYAVPLLIDSPVSAGAKGFAKGAAETATSPKSYPLHIASTAALSIPKIGPLAHVGPMAAAVLEGVNTLVGGVKGAAKGIAERSASKANAAEQVAIVKRQQATNKAYQQAPKSTAPDEAPIPPPPQAPMPTLGQNPAWPEGIPKPPNTLASDAEAADKHRANLERQENDYKAYQDQISSKSDSDSTAPTVPPPPGGSAPSPSPATTTAPTVNQPSSEPVPIPPPPNPENVDYHRTAMLNKANIIESHWMKANGKLPTEAEIRSMTPDELKQLDKDAYAHGQSIGAENLPKRGYRDLHKGDAPAPVGSDTYKELIKRAQGRTPDTTASSEPIPPPPGAAADPAQIVRDAALKLGNGQYKQRLLLRDLRPQLDAAGLSRADQDKAINSLIVSGDADLYPEDNPMGRTAADDAAAYQVGDRQRHVLYLHPKGSRN